MGCFPNLEFDDYNYSTSYEEYDIAYTGINQNKLDNFYYCTGDHSSTESNSPTGVDSMWTQDFFFEPDIGTQNSVEIKADKLKYKNSFTQRFKTNNNIATFDMSYSFNNIPDKQLKTMIHFLENKGGYRRFKHQIPSVYNRPKVYYSPKWTHTWNYVNSNKLSVELKEDPMGVIPTGT
jgi:phage-related protein